MKIEKRITAPRISGSQLSFVFCFIMYLLLDLDIAMFYGSFRTVIPRGCGGLAVNFFHFAEVAIAYNHCRVWGGRFFVAKVLCLPSFKGYIIINVPNRQPYNANFIKSTIVLINFASCFFIKTSMQIAI